MVLAFGRYLDTDRAEELTMRAALIPTDNGLIDRLEGYDAWFALHGIRSRLLM